jgi:chromosome partitioning protein
MEIIAVINRKGGCGKTTTSVNLSTYLAVKGKKVLLMDLDPQGNTTSHFGHDPIKIKNTMEDVITGPLKISDIIIPTEILGLDLVPANDHLGIAERELAKIKLSELILKRKMESLKEYDYVIIDTGPAMGDLNFNAIIACDTILVPIRTDYFSLEGVVAINDAIKEVETAFHRKPKMRYLVTIHHNRRSVCKQALETIFGMYGDAVFKTIIPDTVKLLEAPSHGKPIYLYDPTSPGAKAYERLAEEVIL